MPKGLLPTEAILSEHFLVSFSNQESSIDLKNINLESDCLDSSLPGTS